MIDNPMQERLRAIAGLQPAGRREVKGKTYGVGGTTVYSGAKSTPEQRRAAKRDWYQTNREVVLAKARRTYHAKGKK